MSKFTLCRRYRTLGGFGGIHPPEQWRKDELVYAVLDLESPAAGVEQAAQQQATTLAETAPTPVLPAGAGAVQPVAAPVPRNQKVVNCMKRVYKYPFGSPTSCSPLLQLPAGAQLLHVNSQGSGLYVWALVDAEAPADTLYQVLIVGTGHDLPEGVNARHINTFLVNGGSFVFHAFEVTG